MPGRGNANRRGGSTTPAENWYRQKSWPLGQAIKIVVVLCGQIGGQVRIGRELAADLRQPGQRILRDSHRLGSDCNFHLASIRQLDRIDGPKNSVFVNCMNGLHRLSSGGARQLARRIAYHTCVPAFGEWGFALATRQPWRAPDRYPPGLRFLTVEATAALFQFPPDMGPVEAEINRLNNQILVHYYEREWNQVTQQ